MDGIRGHTQLETEDLATDQETRFAHRPSTERRRRPLFAFFLHIAASLQQSGDPTQFCSAAALRRPGHIAAGTALTVAQHVPHVLYQFRRSQRR